MYDFDYDVTEGVATITLNRPDVLNALTFDIYAQLRDLMAALLHLCIGQRLRPHGQAGCVRVRACALVEVIHQLHS